MQSNPGSGFPRRPFFSCEPDEFLIIDQADMAGLLTGKTVTPWMKLTVGKNNIIESRPIEVIEHRGSVVKVRCAEAVVEIDFVEETARKTLPDGASFVYMGALGQANSAAGWIPVR